MADFPTLESSVEESRPIELYEFTQGSETFRYTSAEDTITPAAAGFAALSIARSTIAQGSDQNNRNVIITMPASEALAQKYVDVPPGQKLNISIFRYQRDEPSLATQILAFKGVVQSVRFPGNGTVAEFTCRSFETAMNRNVPRFTFMGMCNHILGDNNCGVTLSSHSGEVTAVSTNSKTLTIDGLAAAMTALGKAATGGYATITTEVDFRMVLLQSTDDIEILVPFHTDPLGLTVQVFAGCDHTLTGDCALVYDNVAEFGGFAFVPTKDIFNTGVL